ncbi:hypothetical protein COX93_02850 [Candidatus Nomurabacteria bacterium CG_4_10_14_0_2_um_filter_30_12]|uniref:Polymerase beta nucleotidyltransferase domain-containing protein n=2 Tax=Candidatus Nomuraibacteriota TaxID=1752729 RepID=A0A2J0MIW9_9BACT|nr:MAG: hypothetical protein COU48_02485 [Candidatus Nomurabacteria bacterium CG10_big_fil_rev_8_21_14_0_10_03_31_7]PIZ86892.1 MAG: hypothetical protein COX93_02850 [Candidatus Nomurabacteria bacterium CG_4_10_14_0_2_um_filter_30_12]
MIIINQTIEKILSELANEHELKLLVLFGSRVTGRIHDESDYDVAYLSEREFSTAEESEIIFGLMPILRVRDERLINIVDMKTAGPLMLYSITNKGRVLYERENASFFALKLHAWKVFVDTQPFRDNYFRILKERVCKI